MINKAASAWLEPVIIFFKIDLPRPLTPDDLVAVETRMSESVAAGPELMHWPGRCVPRQLPREVRLN